MLAIISINTLTLVQKLINDKLKANSKDIFENPDLLKDIMEI